MIPTTSIGTSSWLDESDDCLAVVPDQETTKPKRSYDLPYPSNTTKEQHLLAAHMMRERSAMMTSRRVKQQSEEQASNAIALLRDSAFFSDRRAKIKQVRGVVIADGYQSTTINMPLTQQTRTADVAKTFDCDPPMATQARAVVAHASCMSDNSHRGGVRAESASHVRGFFVGRGDARDVDAESHSVQ